MIITRTPFRISFVGGGSDLPSFYEKYGGCVLSTTIKKYMYLTIHNYFEKDKIVLKYSKTEIVDDFNKIEHRIFRQCLTDFNLKGVELSSIWTPVKTDNTVESFVADAKYRRVKDDITIMT